MSGEGGGPCGVMTPDGGGALIIGKVGKDGGDSGTIGSMGVLRPRGNGRGR